MEEESQEGPDPYRYWYKYYDANPVSFPRRCKCCKRVFANQEEHNKFELEHLRHCICVTNTRTYPPFGHLDSDKWEPVAE